MSLLEALGYVGDTLAKPGRAVRGALAGRPEELLNLLPFSDTMGLTDPTQQVHGRDLLQKWGAVNEGDDSIGSNLAGFGVDVATDPLTWLGGAALAGAGKLLGKTNHSKLGAVAGSDAANGFFPLTDPIERLIPESEHALRAARGATSEWAPIADDLRPVPGMAEHPPKMTPMGDEIPPPVPEPISEVFSPDNAGYMLAHGPGYKEVGHRYGLAGDWENSIPSDMAADGLKHDAMRTHIEAWNKLLDDFERMTPEARAHMGFPQATAEMDLALPDEIAQLSAHAAPWQQLMGVRHAELGPMRELAIRGALPGEFADDLARQHERITPLLDRWSDGSPLANKLTDLLDEGRVMPSQVGELIHGSQVSPSSYPSGQIPFDVAEFGGKPGLMSHLPVDERKLRALAASRQRETILNDLTADIDNFGGIYGGLDLRDLSATESSSQYMADRLADIFNTRRWHDNGFEGGVFNQVVRQPEQFAGEYAPMIQQARDLLPQLQARAAAAQDPAVAAQLAELVGSIRGSLSATAPFSHAIEKATGVNHMSPLLERLNLGVTDAANLARRHLPEADAGILDYLLRHHLRPYAPPAGA